MRGGKREVKEDDNSSPSVTMVTILQDNDTDGSGVLYEIVYNLPKVRL